MTGFGTASVRDGDIAVSVELKAVNNRYFKLSLRMTDGYASLEPKIEPAIRAAIERGTVNATIRIRRQRKSDEYRISEAVLRSYFERLVLLGKTLEGDLPLPGLDRLALLPGVVETETEFSDEQENERIWNIVRATLLEATQRMQDMRKTEGASMATDLEANIASLRKLVEIVERRAPEVVPVYRQRLSDRIGKILAEQGATLNDVDLLREVALFADRCDISEETVRFRSHLAQFEAAMQSEESCGRKLDFLTQELFRETNTMGSKANDADITRSVVEMKTVIERIREMVQNVE